ncbi:MAG: hypothetical protein MZV65_19040 [Chromatiales bacterium]|nr:hypothetical protein [Chromatiales bacterium]
MQTVPGEVLLDITHRQRRYGLPERIAALVERLAQGGGRGVDRGCRHAGDRPPRRDPRGRWRAGDRAVGDP